MLELPHLDPDHLFGRAALIEQLRATWVAGAKWVSLVGPPGAGKTRIARTFGGCFVDLVGARTPADLVACAAQAVGVTLGDGEQAVARVGRAFAANELVVLDNLEQLVAEVGPVLRAWTQAAPQVRWLGTSRRPVGIPGEVVVPVDGLEADAATALFRARAWAVGAKFEAAELGGIVETLDRLPLAIELAAARSLSLPLPELHDALRRSTALIPALDATLEAAWSLLSSTEQADLRALCEFSAAIPLAAAEAVLDRPALDAVDRLRAYGWLRRDADGRHRHYVGVRAFVRQQQDHPAASTRHARWHGAEGYRLWKAIIGPHPAATLDALAELADDLRATLESGPVESAGGAALGLHVLAMDRGPWQRGTWAIDRALDRGVEGRIRVELLGTRAIADVLCGRYAEGASSLVEALTLARTIGEPDLIAWVLGGLSPARREEGQLAEAAALAREELALAETHGLTREKARALFNLAGARALQDARDEAAEQWHQARALALRIGDVRLAAVCLANLAIMSQETGALSQAQALYDQAMAEFSGMDMPVMRAKVLARRVGLALTLGDLEGAARSIAEGVDFAARHVDDELAVDMGIARAKLAERQGSPDSLARWQAAESLARSLAHPALLERVRSARPARVDSRGRWLLTRAGVRVEFAGRPVLQRVLAALAGSAEPMSVTALFEAAWPDEHILPESAASRVYTAVRALRRAGAAIVTRQGQGYVLES